MGRQWDGAQLKQARLRRGWTQDELARNCQPPTSVTNISRWERDRHGPRSSMIPALATALGVEEGSFFTTNGSDPEEDDEEAEHLRQAFDDLYTAVLKFSRPEKSNQARTLASHGRKEDL